MNKKEDKQMGKLVLATRKYKVGYEVRTEAVDTDFEAEDFNPSVS